MHILTHFLFIRKCFTDQVASVGGCIDQYVVRFFLKTALDHCLQIFIFDLKLFKREIIHVNNELVIAVFDLCDDIIQITELVLVHFDQT